MNENVVSLNTVPKPTAQDEIRADVIEKLKEVLKRAESGDVDEILIIMRHPGDDKWSNLGTPTLSFVRWIGYLEITKADWLSQFHATKG